MIVLEVKFVSNENDFVSMSADILGKTRDMQALAEEKEFEDTIIPVAMNQINELYNNVSLVNNENLCIDMMNVLVARAKKFNYILNRLGQNDKYPGVYQLEFGKANDSRFMGNDKEIGKKV